MARKRSTKRLAAAHAAFRKSVAEYIVSKGAVRVGRFYEYEIDTPAGPLGISFWDNAILTRFEDVVRGTEASASCGILCNRFSGKWNFHFDDDPTSLEPESVLAHFGFYFERLLAWAPASVV